MTDEEIIKEIENIRKFNYTLAPDEVFDRIISALSENEGDLISRKSLLNKIDAYVVGSQDKEFICKLIKEMPSVESKEQMIDKSNFDIDQYKADLQSAFESGYYKGKIDGIKECMAKLEKMNEELANG